MKRQLHLNLFIQSRGHHEASWRHPAASPLPLTDIRYYQRSGAARRGGAVRLDLPRRPAGARRDVAQAPRTWLEPITAAGGAGRRHRADRPDRHRLDDLHRAVQPRAAVRLARPHQRRPRRLEHRHHLAGRRRRATTAGPAGQPRRSLRPGRGVHAVSRRCGTAGPTTPCSTTAARAIYARRRPHPAHQPRGDRTIASPGRSTCRAARRAGRCWCRPARPTPAAASPRATPRRCSPPRWRRRRRRSSTPTSSGWWRRRARSRAGPDPARP